MSPRHVPKHGGGQGRRELPREAPWCCQLAGPSLAALGWENDVVRKRKQGSLPEPIWPGPWGHPAKGCLSSCPFSPRGCWEGWRSSAPCSLSVSPAVPWTEQASLPGLSRPHPLSPLATPLGPMSPPELQLHEISEIFQIPPNLQNTVVLQIRKLRLREVMSCPGWPLGSGVKPELVVPLGPLSFCVDTSS